MSRTRRHFTAEQKAEIVRRQVAGKEAVSDLADEFGVQPSQIHACIKQVLDQAEAAFRRQPGSRRLEQVKDQRIARREEKLVQKNEVIADLKEENVRAIKRKGNSERALGSPRDAGRDCRLRAPLDRAYGVAGQAIAGLDRPRSRRPCGLPGKLNRAVDRQLLHKVS